MFNNAVTEKRFRVGAKNLIMKKTVLKFKFVLSMFLISASLFAGTTNNSIPNDKDVEVINAALLIDINTTVTSAEGCKFKVEGEFSVWSLSFSGTVTAAGGADGCPDGDVWTFGISAPNGGNTGDIRKYKVQGDQKIVEVVERDMLMKREIVEVIFFR